MPWVLLLPSVVFGTLGKHHVCRVPEILPTAKVGTLGNLGVAEWPDACICLAYCIVKQMISMRDSAQRQGDSLELSSVESREYLVEIPSLTTWPANWIFIHSYWKKVMHYHQLLIMTCSSLFIMTARKKSASLTKLGTFFSLIYILLLEFDITSSTIK